MALRLLLSVLFAMLVCPPLVPAASPPSIDAGGVQGLDLKTQLEKGLLVRRPVEFAYIAEIVKLVEEKKLPYSLVATTFTWAQKQPVKKLQYFQFALEVRARRLPVKLPDLRKLAVGIGSNGGQHGVNTPPIPRK
jgi:hypothetical protein